MNKPETVVIQAPHYYAGREAVFGPWIALKPDRMCYKAGFRYYRNGITRERKLTCQFKT